MLNYEVLLPHHTHTYEVVLPHCQPSHCACGDAGQLVVARGGINEPAEGMQAQQCGSTGGTGHVLWHRTQAEQWRLHSAPQSITCCIPKYDRRQLCSHRNARGEHPRRAQQASTATNMLPQQPCAASHEIMADISLASMMRTQLVLYCSSSTKSIDCYVNMLLLLLLLIMCHVAAPFRAWAFHTAARCTAR